MSESEIDKLIKETLAKLRDAVDEMQEETEERKVSVRNGFIKADDGSWINVAKIDCFSFFKEDEDISIVVWINGKSYYIFAGFVTEKEAQEYLDYVIDKLDEEEAQ